MNTFSNMEINDLLSNRLRLEDKHSPNYLAECFQRLFPTLGRMGLSTVVDEIARANHRAFNSSRLPIRGETLDLGFFFELWRREFRFEGFHSDKFTFTDELRLAFRINPRDFWEVLIRADREIGTYLKDSIELLKYRELPREISLNLRPNGSSSDDKTVRLLREKLPHSKDNVTSHEIARVCLQLFEMANPSDYDIRRLVEELEKENSIRRLNGEFTAIIPKKALDRLSTKCVLEFFKNKPLASSEASAMERGVYTVTEADLVLINSQGSEAFWQSIIPDRSIRERTLNMWKLAGMDSDARNFSTGKQILIATERALSDALHKHSAEMRDVYPLCRQAGVSSQDADKFMAMLYLCHDFYPKLETVNITPRFLAGLKSGKSAPAAREVWKEVQIQGLKEGGVQKVNEVLSLQEFKMEEVEVPALNLPPAQKMGQNAKFDEVLPRDAAMFNDEVISNLLVIASSSGGITHGIHTLDNAFEKTIIEDLQKFYASHPDMVKARVTETSRSAESQGKILADALQNSTLLSTYGTQNNRALFTFLTDLKNASQGNRGKIFGMAFYRSEHWHHHFLDYITKSVAERKGLTPQGMESFNHALKGLIFVHFGKYLDKFSYESSKAFFTELSQDALDVIRGKSNKLYYGIEATSNHMKGLAVDFGSSNPHNLKKELVEFFRKENYYILIYHYMGGPIKYKIRGKRVIQPQIDSIPWHELPPTWFFHVDRSR